MQSYDLYPYKRPHLYSIRYNWEKLERVRVICDLGVLMGEKLNEALISGKLLQKQTKMLVKRYSQLLNTFLFFDFFT